MDGQIFTEDDIWFIFTERGTNKVRYIEEIGYFPDGEDDIECRQVSFRTFPEALAWAKANLDTSGYRQ